MKAVFARRLVPWLVAPLSVLVAFAVGMAATWLPPFPKAITSSLGPTLGAIGEPVRIEIPSLGIKAPVVPIELVGDVLTPPGDVDAVGWWAQSAEPGSAEGQTLITGHSVHVGTSAFNTLHEVRRGASVTITSDNKSASYIVQETFTWSKPQVAKHSADLFEPDSHDRRLVLVASAGWDGKGWNANFIAIAQPI